MESNMFWKILTPILLFPTLFQSDWLAWVWADADLPLYAVGIKRGLLLLPMASIIACCWITLACIATILVRQERRAYIGKVLLAWWDLARVIFRFWGGILTFLVMLTATLLGITRLILVGLWMSLQDILLIPFRAIKGVGGLATEAGTPWIAVSMTLLWSLLEAVVFTAVMTPLTIDTVSGIVGRELDMTVVQTILYLMLFTFILGSYAIVASLDAAVKSRNTRQIALVLLVESVAMLFEVIFLYREFVDSLVPWFAQYAGDDFQLGIFFTLAIAGSVWAGTRGMTWFLFAAHGTPPIMAIVQRTGLQSGSKSGGFSFDLFKKNQFSFVKEAMGQIHNDTGKFEVWGEKLLSSFILPPLQVVAGTINFLTLLFNNKALFQLPFKSYKDMIHANEQIRS